MARARDDKGRFQRHPVKDTPLLRQARERFKWANEADTGQAERERDDLAFYAGDQWDADVRLARQGQQPQNGMPAVPSRPTLVINKVREPIRQVQNEIRDSDIGVELVPADDFGDLGVTPDDTEVTLREGLVRRIIRDSNGQDAWNWAGDRADIAGRGYFAVLTRYLPGKTNDQEIYLHRIFNQAGVKGDPSRTEPDGADADWWFVGTWLTWDRFKAEYPFAADGTPNPFSDTSESDFMGLTEQYPDWYRAYAETQDTSGKAAKVKQQTIRIVDYWYTDRTSRTLLTLEDGSVVWEDEAPEGVTAQTAADTRTVGEKTIKFCKIAGGVMILEETDAPGPEMPIIEVVGEELHPYDDQRRIEGMVRNARDAQKGFNTMVSKQVEMIGLTPLPPLHVDPEAIEGYEPWYAVANTRTLPYLPSRTYDDQGRPLKEPHRPSVDPNLLPVAQSVILFDQAIKSTTAVPDPTLGNVDPSLKSGRAIRETVMNAKGSTSNFISNRVRSLERAAKVINSYLYPVYGQTPGRMVRIMTGEGLPEQMVIGESQQQSPEAQQRRQHAAKVAKLTEDAMFNVAVKITKNFETRRQAENSGLGELIAAQPEMMTWFGDLYFSSSDQPNRKQLAERAELMLAPPIQEMLSKKKQGQTFDPAAQAKMAELSERLQMAEAAMQELAQQAEGKQLESQTKLQIADLESKRDVILEQVRTQTDLERAKMDNATKIHVAEIAARTKGVQMAHEAEHEAMALAHGAAQADLDRMHQTDVAASGMAHEAALGEGAQEFDAAEAERGRQATATENAANRQASAQADGAGV